MDIFCKIAAGEIPSYKCAENDEFYAFLDINPLVKGHTLVIPRRVSWLVIRCLLSVWLWLSRRPSLARR